MELLSYRDLREKGIKFHRTHIWRKVKEGSFPPPIKIGAQRNAWIDSEIEEWIAGLVEQRDTGGDHDAN